MEIGTTNRGFKFAKATDIYGISYSVQDSSLAEQAAIWLGGDDGRAHLTQDMVAELLPLLHRFVDTGTIAHDPD